MPGYLQKSWRTMYLAYRWDFGEVPLFSEQEMQFAIRTDNTRWNMLQSCFWVLGKRWSLKHREEINDLLKSSLQLTLTGSIRSAHIILHHTLLQHTIDWLLALGIFFPLQVIRNMGTRTQGSIELSASNTEKSNSREGKWYRFMHPGQNPYFSRTLSKCVWNTFQRC